MLTTDSLKKRYFYKLSADSIGLVFNMITLAIIPRGLGTKAYGDFNFLSSFFTQVSGFFDMGTSTAFYTKLSQRPKESGLVSFYLYFCGIISLLIIAFVSVAFIFSIHTTLWPGQEIYYIYLASVFGVLTWLLQVLNKMVDAYGVTVPAELARISQKAFGMIIIILLYVFHRFNLATYFYYNCVVLLVLGAAFVRVIEKSGHSLKRGWRLSDDKIKEYTKEFYNYSHPLFICSLIGMIVGIFDRWMLQYYSGSVQQGFFGLAFNIGAVCFLFTSAMTPLLTRELSIAYGKRDLSEMARLFRRHIPLLYSIAAFFSCFIAMQSDKIIYIVGGSKYREAGIVVVIMAFFPIHQTYGQLSGSVFYANGQTALYRNIGVFFMLIGVPITFFLIAPGYKMGFAMGARGLAIKTVVLQVIAVNVQLYFNSKFLKLAFWKYFGHQIAVVGCLLLAALAAGSCVEMVSLLRGNVILSFLISGVLYTSITALTVYYMPIVVGLSKDDVRDVIASLRRAGGLLR